MILPKLQKKMPKKSKINYKNKMQKIQGKGTIFD
jgi:hypothetical protein